MSRAAPAAAKVELARAVIAQAAERWPGVYTAIDRSGLTDSPHLIEALAARAQRRVAASR